MEVVQTFNKGINLDVAKTQQPPGTYRNGVNVRLETQENGTLGALLNMDGTTLQFTFPTTSNVVSITLGNPPSFSGITFDININGVVLTVATTAEEFFKDLSEAINSSLALQALGITSAYSDTQTAIWSGLNASNVTITNSIVVMVDPSVTAHGVVITSIVSSQAGVEPIGWTTVRDELVFLTTNCKDKNPGGHSFDPTEPADPSSVGQIWSYIYSPETKIGTLRLLYNNFVDFTTYYAVAQTAIVGRYENPATRKIYWTDFFNPIRNFNIADPNGFAVDVTILASQPENTTSVAILQEIGDSGGVLKAGIYQTAYRLKSNGGAETAYSKASNMVPIINNLLDSTGFPLYTANGAANSGKTITWTIDNIDTDYDRIEIISIYREFRDDLPTIELFLDEPIPQTGSLTFTYTGSETTIPVSLNAFVASNDTITHAKTLTSKDNRLIIANLRSASFDFQVEGATGFDARSYRWKHSSAAGFNTLVTQVKDSQGTSIPVNRAGDPFTWDVPEEHDAINPDQYTQTTSGYRFQSDGLTIGGSGPNIDYKFTTRFFTGDDVLGFTANTTIVPYGYNSRFTNPNSASFPLNNNTFPNNGFYDSFKSPYITSAFKGYAHNETYAFAIRFFDKQGNPGFAKWIADIRMPLIYESIDNGAVTYSHYPVSDRGGFNGAERIGVLVPEFTVRIPAHMQSKIGGWDIVRCERKTDDKQVMAAGTIHPITFDSTAATFYTEGTTNDSFTGVFEGGILGFKSPEFSFLNFPGFIPGDKLVFAAVQTNSYVTTASGSPAEFLFVKNYDETPPAIGPSTVDGALNERHIGSLLGNAFALGRGATGPGLLPATTISNTSDVNPLYSIGDSTVIIDVRGDGLVPAVGPGVPVNYNKYYVYYYRPRTSQYGGNSFSQRANREYISTGQFQPITATTSLATPFVVQITGGDIYTDIWDVQKRIKGYVGGPYATSSKKSITYFMPVESVLNTEWRAGNFVNKTGLPNTGTGADLGDDYTQYNNGWAFEDNIKKGFPKPAVFPLVDEFDTRFRASQIKINGELLDSWTAFLPNDYWDVEGMYGPVNSIFIFNNQLMFLQDRAFGLLPVNQRVLIPDQSASTLQLGTGLVLEKHTYISTKAGCKHQHGNIVSVSHVFFFDTYTRRIYRFGNGLEPLSETEGLSSYLENNVNGTVLTIDKPVYKDPALLGARSGVVAGVDKTHNEVMFTFLQGNTTLPAVPEKAFTIIYNELLGAYSSFVDFKPSMYVYDGYNMFSPYTATPSQMWIHNQTNYSQFYGTQSASQVSIVSNPEPAHTKVFDNISFYTEVLAGNVDQQQETFNFARFYTDYQNSDYVTLDPISTKNIKREERTWNTQVARNAVLKNIANPDIFLASNLNAAQTFKARLRDKVLNIDLIFSNVPNRKLIFHWLKVLFRPSAR